MTRPGWSIVVLPHHIWSDYGVRVFERQSRAFCRRVRHAKGERRFRATHAHCPRCGETLKAPVVEGVAIFILKAGVPLP